MSPLTPRLSPPSFFQAPLQTNSQELREIKPLTELPPSFEEMSPPHLLKEESTARMRVREKEKKNLPCADKRLTCRSHPSPRDYSATHTAQNVSPSVTHMLTRAPAKARVGPLKRSASTSGSPSSSGSRPIQGEEIPGPEVFRPSPRWFDQLAFDPRGALSVSV